MLAVRDGRQTGAWSAVDIMTVCIVLVKQFTGCGCLEITRWDF